MNIKPYTLFVMVGPTNSGKSFFAQKLNQHLKTHSITSVVVSADDLRRELLHDSTKHKHHASMMFASEKAFKKFWATVDSHCEWPNPTQAVILDTTGLSEDFRKEALAKANEHQYNVVFVVFDYAKSAEYSKHVPQEMLNKHIFFKHYKKLKNFYKTMKTFDKNATQVLRVKSKDSYFNNILISLDFSEFTALQRTKLSEQKDWDIIGDVHGCYDDLVTLLQKSLGHTIETTAEGKQRIIPNQSKGIVFVGDIIDKGPESSKVLDLVVNSLSDSVKFVLGNHENFNHMFFQGKVQSDSNLMALREEFFDFSFKPEEQTKLQYLVENSIPFAMNTFMYVTHAPCQTKYIGKVDKYSIRQQRGQYSLDRKSKTLEEKAVTYKDLFSKIKSARNYPYYVFGHISLKRPYRNKNLIGVDTGCVYGNRLTAVRITPQHKPFLYSVESTYKDHSEELPEVLQKEDFVANFDDLDHREYNRIMWCAKNQVAFISGTIAPAEASPETNELESLRKGIEFFKNAGVTHITIQPKYMGSRCQLYLFRDRSKCYAVSRNGYVIKQADLTGVLDKWHKVHMDISKNFYPEAKDRLDKPTILDGELLPWRVLGSGLIDDQYKIIASSLQSELQYLKEAGFDQLFDRLKTEVDGTEFAKDMNLLNKSELYKKYGDAKARTYTSSVAFDFELDQHIELAKQYHKQVEIYGTHAETSFAPFAVLKFFGGPNTVDNLAMFQYVPDWLATPTEEALSNIDDLYAQFKEITQSTEGWVIKPAVNEQGVPSAIKVRGEPYLQLVYGYDYTLPHKYKKLINTKRVWRKLKESIKESGIGAKMLHIEDINTENTEYLTLVYQMVMEERSSVGMDPRL
jgi:predicted kinase